MWGRGFGGGGDLLTGIKDFPDVNAITGALKLYLKQLSVPRVLFEVYEKFLLLQVRAGGK